MKETDEINVKELKAAIKELNDTGFLRKRLKTIGTTVDLATNFGKAIDGLDDTIQKNLPGGVCEMYNSLFDDEKVEENDVEEDDSEEDDSEEDVEEDDVPIKPIKKEKKSKEEKPVKEKKTPPKRDPDAPKAVYGSGLESQAGKIEEMIAKGKSTIDQIVEKTGATKSRIKSHIKYLRDKKELDVVEDVKTKIISCNK